MFRCDDQALVDRGGRELRYVRIRIQEVHHALHQAVLAGVLKILTPRVIFVETQLAHKFLANLEEPAGLASLLLVRAFLQTDAAGQVGFGVMAHIKRAAVGLVASVTHGKRGTAQLASEKTPRVDLLPLTVFNKADRIIDNGPRYLSTAFWSKSQREEQESLR